MNSYLSITGVPYGNFSGSVRIDGAKNAALPELAAALLSTEPVVLNNVPYLADISSMITVISSMGVEVSLIGSRQLSINAASMHKSSPPAAWVQKIRASILLLGPLLARNGYAKIAMPGGCAIGLRPILEHVSGLEALGAKVNISGNVITATASKLKGAVINMNSVSVGATENLMMAAVLAEGTTIINNAAQEPEVVDLAKLLVKMGAQILGAGTDSITINGVKSLGSARHSVMPDRIEAGTYLIAAAAARGKITLTNCPVADMKYVLDMLKQVGAKITICDNNLSLDMGGKRPRALSFETMVYPGFPTDLQAQWAIMSALSDGCSVIKENIFDNRFNYIPELRKMGANIIVDDNTLTINGVEVLHGARVSATDLRAGAALAIAGVIAKGSTILINAHYLDRGYDEFEQKFRACGAVMQREVNNDKDYA